MDYMEYSTTNQLKPMVSYVFKNKFTGNETDFDYEVPDDIFMEEVRNYFDDKYSVKLDGKDNDIWNMLVDLNDTYDIDIIQDIADDKDVIEKLKKRLELDAHEKFEEMCEEEHELESDEDEDDDSDIFTPDDFE